MLFGDRVFPALLEEGVWEVRNKVAHNTHLVNSLAPPEALSQLCARLLDKVVRVCAVRAIVQIVRLGSIHCFLHSRQTGVRIAVKDLRISVIVEGVVGVAKF